MYVQLPAVNTYSIICHFAQVSEPTAHTLGYEGQVSKRHSHLQENNPHPHPPPPTPTNGEQTKQVTSKMTPVL